MNVAVMCVLLVMLIASNVAAWCVVFNLNQKLLDIGTRIGDFEYQTAARMKIMRRDLDFFSRAVLKGLKEREDEQAQVQQSQKAGS